MATLASARRVAWVTAVFSCCLWAEQFQSVAVSEPGSPAKSTDTRTFWRFAPEHGSGFFKKLPDGKWEEIGRDGQKMGIWEELSRTTDYVELYDAKRNYKTRLGVGKAWMASGRDATKFGPSPHGNWEREDGASAKTKPPMSKAQGNGRRPSSRLEPEIADDKQPVASNRNAFIRVSHLTPEFADERAKRAMPKDQAKFEERTMAIWELIAASQAEVNPLKKKEIDGDISKQLKALAADLDRDIAKNGLVGWVFMMSDQQHFAPVPEQDPFLVRKDHIMCHCRSTLIQIQLTGLSDEAKAVIRELKPGDLFTATFPSKVRKRDELFFFVKGSEVKDAKAVK